MSAKIDHIHVAASCLQRRLAVGRSRAGQRSGVVRARPARRQRVVVSVDVSGHATASLGRPSRRPPARPARATSSVSKRTRRDLDARPVSSRDA